MDNGERRISLVGEGALCRTINESCTGDSECPAIKAGSPCWTTEGISCCSRNDKSRCCYCSVFLAYVNDGFAAGLFPVDMHSHEDDRFAELGRRMYEYVRENGEVEIASAEDPTSPGFEQSL